MKKQKTMVANVGLEPTTTESKSVVLPLHQSAICGAGELPLSVSLHIRVPRYALHGMFHTSTFICRLLPLNISTGLSVLAGL